jgi:hypothetical protein
MNELATYFEDTQSAYGFIKGVNKILSDLGSEKELPTPMGYTYAKKGYVATVDDERKIISRAGALEWTVKYLKKNGYEITEITESDSAEDLQEILEAQY